MIEKNLLMQLGWSEDLIDEVTRVSNELSRSQPSLPQIGQTPSALYSDTCDSLFYNSDQSNTTDQLISAHRSQIKPSHGA
jgi:hypothetical protein